jgi:hypothetical protein
MSDNCPSALDVIEINRCCGAIFISVGTPLFQRRPIKYHNFMVQDHLQLLVAGRARTVLSPPFWRLGLLLPE